MTALPIPAPITPDLWRLYQLLVHVTYKPEWVACRCKECF